MCTNAGQFGQAIGQASEGEVRRGHQPGITCRYVSMYMGARNAQVDVIIAHTSASIVRMDTRTVYVGARLLQQYRTCFLDLWNHNLFTHSHSLLLH